MEEEQESNENNEDKEEENNDNNEEEEDVKLKRKTRMMKMTTTRTAAEDSDDDLFAQMDKVIQDPDKQARLQQAEDLLSTKNNSACPQSVEIVKEWSYETRTG